MGVSPTLRWQNESLGVIGSGRDDTALFVILRNDLLLEVFGFLVMDCLL